MDFEIQRCTRHCAATGRDLAPGEEIHSVLVAEGANLVRYDYSREAWQGPPQQAVGSWKSHIPGPQQKRRHWAPNDVLLQCFDELAEQPEKQDMRYVLALLLTRRRVLRLEETDIDPQAAETLVLYCPRRDTTYRVPATVPQQSRIEQIQDELAKLLQ